MKKFITLFALTLLITAFTSQYSFSQDTNSVVLEEATGTWCGWCPCGHQVVETIKANFPKTIFLLYHGGSSSDPWISYSSGIISLFGFTSYPSAVVGRISGIVSRNAWLSYVSMLSTYAPGVRIEVLDRTYNTATRTVSGNVKVTTLSALSGNYNISFVLTEDRIVYPQMVYSGCGGHDAYQNDYVHNYVVKGVINGTLGQQIFSDAESGQVFTLPFSYSVPTTVAEANASINIFVFKNTTPIGSAATIQNGFKLGISDFSSGIAPVGTIVTDFSLGQNYPNPFNPTTHIKFSVPKNTWATFKIYDMLGKEVASYLDHYYIEAGEYNVEVNASSLPSGIYFYKLSTKDFTDVKKMTVLK
jgi:hypothetical protein